MGLTSDVAFSGIWLALRMLFSHNLEMFSYIFNGSPTCINGKACPFTEGAEIGQMFTSQS